MNLYQKYRIDERKRKNVGSGGTAIAFLVAIALIIGAYGLKLTLDVRWLKSDIIDHQLYITNPSNIEKGTYADAVVKENQELMKLRTAIEEINTIFSKKSTISSNVFTDILLAKPIGTNLDNININSSNVVISFSSKNQKHASEFVSNLKSSSIIKTVNYSGYEYDTSNEIYKGTVALILKGDF